ncbi:hypothetical protein TTHERM_00437270 (macronuclear) [Tetrahymena thermophila SB210]|uniref:Uncharacterized protein n=1 Tax=Tetrahymena thermophila (strain SB210) TaxID=312017 RepID=I7M8A0_TETTS|nr:hypothetical protein TTHERM_00437270 [Tetrahymena thermophila SB210]EAR97478.3 hypothetical protein TTHERM_00437270 [Tetrahymena thermophila SB210]|eukprot:XP_001017723.3 hypothetical protein TTHERM_00437270 [Tetrahymena thermophila SB210]
METKNIPSNQKAKNPLNKSLKQIFAISPEISKQNSQTSFNKDHLSTQINESLDLTISASLRKDFKGDLSLSQQLIQQQNESMQKQNRFKVLQQNLMLNVKGHSPISNKGQRALSQLSTCSSTDTPQDKCESQNCHNINSTQSLNISNNHQILCKLPKIQNKSELCLHKIHFFPQQKELDKLFHKPVNQEKAKLYSFINQNQISKDNQLHQLVYKKLAPITSIYNQSQIFETKKLSNFDQNLSPFPRYYFKQNKQRVEKQFGNQYAYQLINNINLQKKLSLIKAISTRNTKLNLDTLQNLNQK